ncbi:MAG: universal stress protein [Xenococcaceae cyanobacterium]
MIDKILIAIDRSTFSKTVFSEGLTLAKNMGASLMLLHVLFPQGESESSLLAPTWTLGNWDYYSGADTLLMEDYHKQWQEYRQQSLNFLCSLAEEAMAQGIQTEWTQNAGNPGTVICDVAKTWGANLIVVGRRGHSSLSELLLGSISNYVLHRAPCSVLVVHYPAVAESEMASRDRAEMHC